MARNKYPGTCYCCGVYVPPGYGHFEKVWGATGWRVKCVKCASGRVLTNKDPGVVWAQKTADTKGLPQCDKCPHLHRRKRADGNGGECWCPLLQRDVKQSVFGGNSPRDCPQRGHYRKGEEAQNGI